VNGDSEGFEHRAVGKTQAARELEDRVRRVRQKFPERAVNRWAAEKPDIRAKVGIPLDTPFAYAAGKRGIHRHTIPDPELSDPFADPFNHSGGFVAQNKGALYRGISDATVFEIVDIRAADSDGFEPNQDLAGLGLRSGHLLYAHIAGFVKFDCFHGETLFSDSSRIVRGTWRVRRSPIANHPEILTGIKICKKEEDVNRYTKKGSGFWNYFRIDLCFGIVYIDSIVRVKIYRRGAKNAEENQKTNRLVI